MNKVYTETIDCSSLELSGINAYLYGIKDENDNLLYQDMIIYENDLSYYEDGKLKYIFYFDLKKGVSIIEYDENKQKGLPVAEYTIEEFYRDKVFKFLEVKNESR